MPIYAFECTTCGHQFDKLQKLSDADPIICPDCGAHTLKRQLTAPSFRLSGSGWYETDFKKDGDKKRNLTGSGDGAKGEAAPGKGEGAGKADGASKGEAASRGAGDKSAAPPAKSSDAKPAAATPAPAAKPKSESPPK